MQINKTYKNWVRFGAAVMAAGALSGCVKDDIFDEGPVGGGKSQLTITTDWNDRGAGIDKPSSYMVTAAGFSAEASSDKYTAEFEPGSYKFRLYNNAGLITVTDGTAKVKTLELPEEEPVPFIEPMPGWLFTGGLSTTIEKDKDQEHTVSMRQQVRELKIVIKPEDWSTDSLQTIQATLFGAAGAWDIDSNVPLGDAVNVGLGFEKQPDGSLAATVRLLGITGAQQILTLDLYFSPKFFVSFDEVLTDRLDGFNDDKKTPMSLTLSGQFFYSIGDIYPHTGTPLGIVYSLDYPWWQKGLNGRILSLDQTTGIKWGPEGTANADNQGNGLLNMATIAGIENWRDEYDAFAWVDAKNLEGTIYWDYAKHIWYLPSLEECRALSDTFRDMPEFFNEQLNGAGGVPINDVEFYFSSTQFLDGTVQCINLRDGNSRQTPPTATYEFIRAVMAF